MRKFYGKHLLAVAVLGIVLGMIPFTIAHAATPVMGSWDKDNLTITNNAGAQDEVKLTGLKPGNILKVYDKDPALAIDAKLLGQSTVKKGEDFALVKLNDVGDVLGGSVYVTVTLDTAAASITALPAIQTGAPIVNQVYTNNWAVLPDTIKVVSLADGDVINVYDAVTAGNKLGTAKAAKTKADATKFEAMVSLKDKVINTLGQDVWVTLTSKNKRESDRTKVAFAAEDDSNALDPVKVTIDNKADPVSDTVKLTGLADGDVITVYDAASSGNKLGTGKSAKTKADATKFEALITIKQVGSVTGSVYATLTSKGYLESPRIKVDFAGEVASTDPDAANITVDNKADPVMDTVKVAGLKDGDTITVYDAASAGNKLGTAKAAKTKADATKYEAVASIKQLGTVTGSVYVSLTSRGYLESWRTQKDYLAEEFSIELVAGNITVLNKKSPARDTVTVKGLNAGDLVTVYDSAGTVKLGSSKASGTTLTVTLSSNLGAASGTVQVTVASVGKREQQTKTSKDYDAEVSPSPVLANITVTNAATAGGDSVQVTGLLEGDIVKVYKTGQNTALGTKTVAASATSATVTGITLPAAAADAIEVTVTRGASAESDKIKVTVPVQSP